MFVGSSSNIKFGDVANTRSRFNLFFSPPDSFPIGLYCFSGGNKKLKFSYKEQKEYETIEDDIAALEQKLEDLDNEMAANATNAAKLRELVEEKENAEKMLEEKMDRWVYLEELAAKIAGQQS